MYDSERIIPEKIPANSLRVHLARYQFAKSYCTKNYVLDVASGAGYGSKLLSETAKQVVGGEVSKEAVIYGQKKWKSKNLSYIVLNGGNLPFYNKIFDVVVSFETIEHLAMFDSFTSECARVLKKNGIFVCSTCNKNVLTACWKRPLNPFHKHEFNQAEFENLLRMYFDQVEVRGLLFLDPINRFKNMLYYTLGFVLVRLSAFSLLQPIITLLASRNVINFLSADMSVRKFSNSQCTPGYIIAVCRSPKF